MSLKAFKEALKPCTASTVATTTTTTPQTTATFTNCNPNPSHPKRIPPKTSISQQLLRLNDSTFLENHPSLDISNPDKSVSQPKDERIVSEDDEGEEFIGFGRPNLDVFSFGETGPFEPLVLSSPGVVPVVQVPASINCRLLEHQRDGVKFLYRLYKNDHGGILGDDMGLGKTIQTIAFLAAVFAKDTESGDQATAKKNQKGPVLIIGPASVLQNWENEFSNWANFRVSIYHGPNRDLILDKVQAHELEVMITSFDTFRIYGTEISEVMWDIVIVDEAHRLKNERSKLYIACLGIKTKRRYGLTGTVMQNKIMELFNLFDWVAPGSLGSREHFRDFYDEPLKLGQRSSAPETFVRTAEHRKKHLATLLSKYLLRRTKEETVGNLMLGKEDNIVFCDMSEPQKRAYKRMLQQPEIQCLINKDLPCSCGSPLTQGECHNRIVPEGVIWRYLHRDNPEGCDWCPGCLILPCILKLQQISNHVELIKPNPRDDEDKQRKDAELAELVFGSDIELVGGKTQNESFMGLSDVRHCGKMNALERLMTSWISHGDKVLLFSHSVRMLDILEKFMIRKGYFYTRLDGSTPTRLRQSLVNDFNSSPSMQVFLISTRAGGLGLNLVSANRVVIFDPSWNPSHDLQAQDRSFRLGQKRHVVVFRLIAAGSLEELVYTRQVYKQQLSNIAVSGKLEKRYFEGVQDNKQFQGELFGICNLFRDLSDELFTSDIIELHEKHKQDCEGGEKQNHNNIGEHLGPSKESSDSSLPESSVTNTYGSQRTKSNKPLLEELGIRYSHRFEDIVNVGTSKNVSMDANPTPNGSTNEVHSNSVSEAKQSSGNMKAKLSLNQKKRQFSLVSRWKGMTEVEFSKWVISASSCDLEKALHDYKKSKKEKISRLDSD